MTSGLCETGRGGCATARRPLAVVTAVGPILAGGRAEIQARRREIKPVARIRVPGICVPGFASPDSLPRARAKGAALGLLHGVPITIKENVDYKGRPNPNGVPALMNLIAPSDAPVVANLKKAGAIVLVHLDTAVRVLAAEEAQQIDQALEGLAAVLRGEPFEQHFAGLSGGMPVPPESAASS